MKKQNITIYNGSEDGVESDGYGEGSVTMDCLVIDNNTNKVLFGSMDISGYNDFASGDYEEDISNEFFNDRGDFDDWKSNLRLTIPYGVVPFTYEEESYLAEVKMNGLEIRDDGEILNIADLIVNDILKESGERASEDEFEVLESAFQDWARENVVKLLECADECGNITPFK